MHRRLQFETSANADLKSEKRDWQKKIEELQVHNGALKQNLEDQLQLVRN